MEVLGFVLTESIKRTARSVVVLASARTAIVDLAAEIAAALECAFTVRGSITARSVEVLRSVCTAGTSIDAKTAAREE